MQRVTGSTLATIYGPIPSHEANLAAVWRADKGRQSPQACSCGYAPQRSLGFPGRSRWFPTAPAPLPQLPGAAVTKTSRGRQARRPMSVVNIGAGI